MTLQKPTMPLGGCPRIAIFSKIEECPKKLPQAYSRYSEDNFFGYDEEGEIEGVHGEAKETQRIVLLKPTFHAKEYDKPRN